jgi:hypothetical protein
MALAPGVTLNIGRTRGEFEDAKKALVRVHAGAVDPDAAGFWEMKEAGDRCARAAAWANARQKHGRLLHRVPEDHWAEAIAADPLRKLSADLRHVFLPETRPTVLRDGHVMARVDGKLFAWQEPELFAALGTGFAVAIKFDPTEPSLGAAIYNREAGSRNRWGWAVGELLALAEYVKDAPQIMAGRGFLTEEEEESIARRRRFNGAVRAEYRSIVGHGRTGRSVSEGRDGDGQMVRVERGTVAEEPQEVGGRRTEVRGRKSEVEALNVGGRNAAAPSEAPRRRFDRLAALMEEAATE